MKKFGKGLSILLCATVILGVTSCSKDNKETVEEGSEFAPENLIEAGTMPSELPENISWYDYRPASEISEHMREFLGDDCYQADCVSYDDKIYVLGVGHYVNYVPTEQGIAIFDKDLNPISDIKLDDSYGSPSGLLVGDKVYYQAYDRGASKHNKYAIEGDHVNTTSEGQYATKVPSSLEYYYDVEFKLPIVDVKTGEVESEIDISGLKTYGVEYIGDVEQIAENRAIVKGYGDYNPLDGSGYSFIVDLDTGEITPYRDIEWLQEFDPHNIHYVSEKSVVSTADGIYELDFDKQEATIIFGADYANCNRYIVANSKPVMISDDTIVICYDPEINSDLFDSLTTNVYIDDMYIMKKSDTYDQAGKTVISVATFEAPNYTVAQAIYDFNKNSKEGYAVYDNRYRVDIDMYGLNYDDYSMTRSNAYIEASDKLAVDLISGDGPDVLLGNSYFSRFNNDDYFIDVSDLVSELGSDEYLSNVFEAAKYEGKLYQIPLAFSVEGLFSKKEAFNGKTGITFDEYQELVSGYCNGEDPLYSYREEYSRSELMATLFGNMQDKFISDGKIDVNTDSFRSFLDYCKTTPKEGLVVDYDDVDAFESMLVAAGDMDVKYTRISSFSYYCDMVESFGEDFAMCGLPSVDSRGASIIVNCSAAVSATAKSPDLCKDFLRSLLSPDVQLGYATPSMIPVNKDAIRVDSRGSIGEFEDIPGFYHYTFTESDIDKYIALLSEPDFSNCSDGNINMIIFEEAPAYFEGQKSFEEVAQTINNRAQLVLDEQN